MVVVVVGACKLIFHFNRRLFLQHNTILRHLARDKYLIS